MKTEGAIFLSTNLLFRLGCPFVGFLGQVNLPVCGRPLHRLVDPALPPAHGGRLPEQLDHDDGGRDNDEAGHDADIDLLGGDGNDIGQAAKGAPHMRLVNAVPETVGMQAWYVTSEYPATVHADYNHNKSSLPDHA